MAIVSAALVILFTTSLLLAHLVMHRTPPKERPDLVFNTFATFAVIVAGTCIALGLRSGIRATVVGLLTFLGALGFPLALGQLLAVVHGSRFRGDGADGAA